MFIPYLKFFRREGKGCGAFSNPMVYYLTISTGLLLYRLRLIFDYLIFFLLSLNFLHYYLLFFKLNFSYRGGL